ncbi:MBOAT family O-acyltransferase [Acetivibrio saccincola]|uniref:MBOAT family O-acyltransferase n=1 Tax=Acetivibrio saccincola TaxID=1677857 RepID=UPI000A846F05|nr:MBOAT family O-acyltransferase [Acetivibrio saccincola]NLW27818.1 MBOAT family protein [Acetivibrio saccincola]
MVFSSLFFLCVFLPVNIILYYAVNNNTYRNVILIVSSLVFYAWGEPVWILVLILSGFFNYFIGTSIEKNRENGKGKGIVSLAIIANLFILGFFKYFGFFVENLNTLTGIDIPIIDIGLPIGISFYTFKSISYIVDVYRGEVKAEKSPFEFLLYVSLFHHLVAGPIVRYKDVEENIKKRAISFNAFNNGVERFIIGLGKKVIIANQANEFSKVFLDMNYSSLPVLGAWAGILLFAIEIYFDFSGYSDMAIGLGKMYGFHYKENFNYPYIAKSATEFWRRWHISLTSFFKDYVYIPLGGNRKFHIRNMLIVWLLTGLWHGASWNFVIWGLYFFVLLVIEKYLLFKIEKKIPKIIWRLYFVVIILVGWVFFYHSSLSDAIQFLGIMFGAGASSFSSSEVEIFLNSYIIFIGIALIGCTPFIKSIFQRIKGHMEKKQIGVYSVDQIVKSIVNTAIFIMSIIMLVGQSYSPFLYFKF